MTVIVSVLLLTFLIFKVQSYCKVAFYQKHQYQLYTLRDALRKMAIEGKVDSDCWLFDYLDSTLTKTAIKIPDLSIYNAAVFYVTHKNNALLQQHLARLEEELAKKENAQLKDVMDKLSEALGNYFLERHRLLVAIVVMCAFYAKMIKPKIDRVVCAMRVMPETSTFEDYACVA